MTVCNMAIEAGARAGMVGRRQDHRVRQGRPLRADRRRNGIWRCPLAHAAPDADAVFDAVVELDAAQIVPQVTWGTSPKWSPASARARSPKERDATADAMERAR